MYNIVFEEKYFDFKFTHMYFTGRNSAIELLKSKLHKIDEIIIDELAKVDEKIETIVRLSKSKNIKINLTSRKNLNKIAGSEDNQGVCVKARFNYSELRNVDLANLDKSFVYIYENTFEHNLGAIIRSAECAGFAGVIIPKGKEINDVIARTSAGAVFHIPIIQNSIFNTIKDFQRNGINIFGIERDGTIYTEANINYPSLFIIGGEDKELSEEVRSKCTDILEIPQFGEVNSLNMSVAASIVMFEHVRQAGQK